MLCYIQSKLWFAWKFVPLWYQQQLSVLNKSSLYRCDLLENSYLCGISNNALPWVSVRTLLWFAWKFVPLWYQQQRVPLIILTLARCDLLENSYLCGISNNSYSYIEASCQVVICLKIRTFVVSATTAISFFWRSKLLWFAWKFVPLWYQQQQIPDALADYNGCDLLENSYLCGISNNAMTCVNSSIALWFAWKFVPLWYQQQLFDNQLQAPYVVICLKIRTFVVSATTKNGI